MATDLAEFLGAAIGFKLLIGTSLLVSTGLTAIAAFAILGLQRFGFRPFEAVIAAIVGVIGACYLAELFYSHPRPPRRRLPRGRAGVQAGPSRCCSPSASSARR